MTQTWIIAFAINCVSPDTTACLAGRGVLVSTTDDVYRSEAECQAAIPKEFDLHRWQWPAEFEYRAACVPVPFDPEIWPVVIPADPARKG